MWAVQYPSIHMCVVRKSIHWQRPVREVFVTRTRDLDQVTHFLLFRIILGLAFFKVSVCESNKVTSGRLLHSFPFFYLSTVSSTKIYFCNIAIFFISMVTMISAIIIVDSIAMGFSNNILALSSAYPGLYIYYNCPLNWVYWTITIPFTLFVWKVCVLPVGLIVSAKPGSQER